MSTKSELSPLEAALARFEHTHDERPWMVGPGLASLMKKNGGTPSEAAGRALAAEVRRLQEANAHAIREGVKIGEERNEAVKALCDIARFKRYAAQPPVPCEFWEMAEQALAKLRAGKGAP